MISDLEVLNRDYHVDGWTWVRTKGGEIRLRCDDEPHWFAAVGDWGVRIASAVPGAVAAAAGFAQLGLPMPTKDALEWANEAMSLWSVVEMARHALDEYDYDHARTTLEDALVGGVKGVEPR
jgi:hypothetical protein